VTADEALLEAMAHYFRREAAQLRQQEIAELLAGRVAFGPPPLPASASPASASQGANPA
jgi:hypothetical protein